MADENDYVNRGYDMASDVKYLSTVRRTPHTAAQKERCMAYYWPALLPVLDAASYVLVQDGTYIRSIASVGRMPLFMYNLSVRFFVHYYRLFSSTYAPRMCDMQVECCTGSQCETEVSVWDSLKVMPT